MHKGASPTTVSWEDFTAPLPPGAEVEIPCGTRVEVRDAGYRRALRDTLATGGRRVVLGDEAVRAAVGDTDNYFVFAVAAAVLARGSHVLDIRRGHCPGPCVNP